MGLLDILNDIQGGVSNDPRAQAAPARQGMSPMAKALLGLLAIYAMKHMRRADAPPTQQGRPSGANVGLPGGQGGEAGGGLGDLLRRGGKGGDTHNSHRLHDRTRSGSAGARRRPKPSGGQSHGRDHTQCGAFAEAD